MTCSRGGNGPGRGAAGDLLRVAHLLADAADEVTMSHFRARELRSWRKDDGSVVTAADLAAEQRIRAAAEELTPGVTVLGEELSGGGGDHCWIVDPIDGTESFRRGSTAWGTLIARRCDGLISDAVISAPAAGRRWWASRAGGAFTDDGRRLQVSAVPDVAACSICYGGIHEFDPAEFAQLLPYLQRCRTAWGWANFWGHVQVAEGVADVALSNGTAVWDVAAASLIVSEAGGQWSDFDGRPRLDSGHFVTSNSLLHPGTVAVTDRLRRAVTSGPVAGGGC